MIGNRKPKPVKHGGTEDAEDRKGIEVPMLIANCQLLIVVCQLLIAIPIRVDPRKSAFIRVHSR